MCSVTDLHAKIGKNSFLVFTVVVAGSKASTMAELFLAESHTVWGGGSITAIFYAIFSLSNPTPL